MRLFEIIATADILTPIYFLLRGDVGLRLSTASILDT